MTNDDIVMRGDLAARLLANAELISFFDEMKDDIRTALFNTAAKNTEERERLYFKHQGIEDVLATMSMYSARAEAILRSREEIINNSHDD